jgi:NAD(P)H-dependent FMN reductase
MGSMNEITGTSRLVIIVGSVRQGRFGPTVASWVADRAHEHGGFGVELVDLAGTDIPLLDWWARAPRAARAAVPYPGGA